MPVEKPIPQDYVEKNQNHWRKAKRGIGSRPIELPRLGNLIHTRLKSTFSEYGVEQITEPILTFSILTDVPQTPSSTFVHQERYPEGIKQEDKQDYLIGISRINEYATNYATKEFFKKNADVLGFKQVAGLYGELSDLATYGVLLNGTFGRMRDLEIMAKHNKKDYKHALLNALFKHDTAELNEIVALGSDYYGFSDIDNMAIEIGRKRYKKPDIGKWFDKLDANRTDGKIKSAAKNGILSTAAMGVYRNPGVIETHGAIFPASPVISGVGTFAVVESLLLKDYTPLSLEHPEHIQMVLEQIPDLIPQPAAAIMGTALFISPFVAVHESIHHASADETHLGLIPTQLIQKEVTPYKARLEAEEK